MIVPVIASQKQLHRQCPLCRHDNARNEVFQKQGVWLLKKCDSCGFVYLENPPQQNEFEEKYAWEKTTTQERQRRQRAEPKLKEFSVRAHQWRKKLFKRKKLQTLIHRYAPGGTLLDVGCGSGKLLASCMDTHQTFGIEISKQLAGLAQTRGRIFCQPAVEAMASFPETFFNVVVMSSYLEHEINPLSVLKGVHGVLNSSGHLIVKVPNFGSLNRRLRGSRWCGYRFPDHVNYFDAHSLQNMLKLAGFQIARFRFCDYFPTSDTLWIVAQKR